MRRFAIALLLLVSTISLVSGFVANAGGGREHCWWAGYTGEMWGKTIVSVGPYCVPCFRACGSLPPSPNNTQLTDSQAAEGAAQGEGL